MGRWLKSTVVITSYSIHYTKLYDHEHAGVAPRRGTVRVDRITSYNVCYTKLLRDEQGEQHQQQGHQVEEDHLVIGVVADAEEAVERLVARLLGPTGKLQAEQGRPGNVGDAVGADGQAGEVVQQDARITSYNVCYTKLLRNRTAR